MTYSQEGTGTITRFWLELDNGRNVSPTVNVNQNSSKQYYVRADSDANGAYVRLTAENNNFSASTYAIKGVWDEETTYVLPIQYDTYQIK